MIYRSKEFELERTAHADTLVFTATKMRVTLEPGCLERLFKFLGPLCEDTAKEETKR